MKSFCTNRTEQSRSETEGTRDVIINMKSFSCYFYFFLKKRQKAIILTSTLRALLLYSTAGTRYLYTRQEKVVVLPKHLKLKVSMSNK